MIRLQDWLQFSEEKLPRVKVKFNNWTGENPLQNYLSDPETVDNFNLFWRNKNRNYSVGDIAINLIQMGHDKWLLTTIKRVTKELGVTFGQNYTGEVLEEYSPYFARLILHCKRPGRASVFSFQTVIDHLEVHQLLPEVYGGEEFPGYDNICLTYQQLESILRLGKKDWLTALTNQKAVYLITDTYTGKLYVGSATSDYGMLLSRWQSYIQNGHGGNKELLALVNREGFDYVKKYFQYSVLENYNAKIDDKCVLGRETYWKQVLKTREFGYNEN
ncbi:GIY-YIG nuclease family protein [Streptococcus ruminantium]|uniref:GIY-YIG nuclease family protein n=1 Tax=Streptococcus ruminantium TaxID=1917441 RepID=UPI0012DF00D8|nr:GIY-YIG nuclease family protein [Streptococcus ruminantium]